MKNTRRRLSKLEREQAAEFHAVVQEWRCAMCGTWTPPMDAHHVVAAQELRRRNLPTYDVRNALPLHRRCHDRHEGAYERVPFRKLRAENVAYAFEVLGEFASDYLKRRYPVGRDDEEAA